MQKRVFESQLFKFAFFPGYSNVDGSGYSDRLDSLAGLAADEAWDYSGTTEKNYPILKNYLEFTFRRLKQEKKIIFTSDNKYACFNTGLVTKNLADFNSSSDSSLRKAAEELEKERKKMSEKAEFHQKKKKELFNAKIHGHWNDTIPTEEEARNYGDKFLKSMPDERKETKQTSPKKTLSLREEAIELALKLGDGELVKYLEKAPMKSIQRRIKALREEVEKMGKKSPKKFQPKRKTKDRK